MMDLITTALNNRFEIVQPLSKDGKTNTYLALDTRTGKQVVLKELNLGQAADWKSIELFERESQILRHLDHPAIPSHIDAFHTHDTARLWVAQQYISGENLESILNNGTTFDATQIRELLDQMLDVLTYLHSFSPPVIHRNIKPSNILHDENGRFHLVDFGSVQTIAQDKLGGSTIVGTSGYMPPEQLMGRAQPATDIYARAATCIHLTSGQHPVNLPIQRMKMQFREHVTLPESLCNILEKMLEPDISKRFTRPEQIQKPLDLNHFTQSSLINTQSQSHALTPANHPDLNTLIANPPVVDPVSKIQLYGDTLSIDIHIPRTKRWLEPAVAALFVITLVILFSTGIVTSDLVCVCTPFIAVVLFSFLKTARKGSGSGSEKLILSPRASSSSAE